VGITEPAGESRPAQSSNFIRRLLSVRQQVEHLISSLACWLLRLHQNPRSPSRHRLVSHFTLVQMEQSLCPQPRVIVDLHNHILFDIDDGARDLVESLEIARQFLSEGVRVVAATPHFNPKRQLEGRAEQTSERLRVLQDALDVAAIPLQVVVGNEILLTPDTDQLVRDGYAHTLGDGRAVLVEANFDVKQPYLEDQLVALCDAGYQPILAHPERCVWMRENSACAADLSETGVIFQLTAPSLLGEYGSSVRQIAMWLLERGYYASAASDRHHPNQPRSLADLYNSLTDVGGPSLADLLLCENPTRLLRGEPVMLATVPGDLIRRHV